MPDNFSNNGLLRQLISAMTGGGSSSTTVQGSGAGGSIASGNPVGVGGVYNSTMPTYTNGQRTDVQAGSRGSLNVTLFAQDSVTAVNAIADNADGVAVTTSLSRLAVAGRQYVFNGTTWDRQRGDTSGAYMVNAPSAASAVGLTPVVGVGVSSLVVKASAGNFYSASVTNNTTAGFLIVYNANAAPAGGAALTASLILAAVPVAASGYASVDQAAIPDRASAGVTLLFSTSTTTYTVPATLPLHMRGRAA